MRTGTDDDAGVGRSDEVIRAIIRLMDSESADGSDAVLVRTIRTEAALDLEDDEILCVVRDAGDHGRDARFALDRLLFLSHAEAHGSGGPMPR